MKTLIKNHHCFCGKKFDNGWTFSKHIKTCNVYKCYKDKYLTYDNFYQQYMVDKKMYQEFLNIYPYNEFHWRHIRELQNECNFPEIKVTKKGKRLFSFEIDNILTYDFLYEFYIRKGMTANEIANDILNGEFDHTTIENHIKRYNIPYRNFKTVMMSERFLKKMSSDEIKQKRKNTWFQKYGVNTPLVLDRIVKIRSSGKSPVSLKLFNTLCNNFPEYKEFFKFGDNEKIVNEPNSSKFYYLDFSYDKNGVKFDIEFNGDYYHMNPRLYSPDHPASFFKDGTKTASDVWEYDVHRKKIIENAGYKILIVWEYDYVKNKAETINKCIKFINENIGES